MTDWYKPVDALQLGGYVNVLRAVGRALVASYAVVGLTQPRDGAVIAHKESATCRGIVGTASRRRHVVFVDTLVVVQQYGWYVDAIGARHTVFAVVARDGWIGHHQIGRVVEKLCLFLRQRVERTICEKIVLEMFHIGHAAEHCQHSFG